MKVDKRVFLVLIVLLLVCLVIALYLESREEQETEFLELPGASVSASPSDAGEDSDEIPPWSGAAYAAVHGNEPYFTREERGNRECFEDYSDLDELGRCGVAYANIGQELMPTEGREGIGSVKPSGWQSVRYDGVVDGGYLYNRCHLIGFQLAGENANPRNLITGTRYLNIDGMLGFEDLVADYVKETDRHVLYRVTPVYEGDELVARGVLMEGWSVEDGGEGVCFCVFAYNVQPGVEIDYATGESVLTEEGAARLKRTYVLNTSGKTFHLPDCPTAQSIGAANREEITCTRGELTGQGYGPCGRCQP